MGTDYHRGQTESIPTQDEYRPVVTHDPPQRHYSADSGEWDGQLPHTDVVAQAQTTQDDHPNWPNFLERSKWTRAIIRAFQLPPPQAAALNEVAYRDGRGLGCTATMATIALDTGYNEKSIRSAIKELVDKKIILANGGPGQKKLLALPVKQGQLPWPTPVTDSGVQQEQTGPTPVRGSGVDPTNGPTPVTDSGVQQEQTGPTPVRGSGVDPTNDPTPVTDSGVQQEQTGPTPVRGSGVDPNPGNRFRATPVTGSDITVIKQEERENKYISSLSPYSPPGSPVTDSGVATDDPNFPHPVHGSDPTSVRESEVSEDKTNPENDRISALVVQNWPLIATAGWNYLDAAIKHYQTHGITYLQRDLRIKQQNLERAEMATRTCAHCKKIHDNADQLRPCAMCNELKCVSELSICNRTGCQGKPNSRGQQGPSSRQRR